MPPAAATSSSAVVGRAEHVCVVYDDAATFRDRAHEFLTDGSAAGARLEYLGRGSAEELRSSLRTLPGFGALLDSGQLTVRALEDLYGDDEVVDPEVAVAAYAEATEDALAQGYTRLRVAADATALVRTPAQREAFGRYEHLIDRYMLDHPFDAMCGYDRRLLGEQPATEIACLHPRVNRGASSFQWCAAEGYDVRLSGEVDIAAHEVFDLTLARTMPLLHGPRAVEAQGLAFIDHRGMLALDRHARAAGAELTLLTDAPLVHRLAGLLQLSAVQPRWSR
jgi:hypothetical protein